MALAVEVGLGVLRELLAEEVEGVVGPKGRWNRERTAVRHGYENGEVSLGGRRVRVKRPRVRAADGESELPVESYELVVEGDPPEEVVVERMLAGRGYGRAQEPVGERVQAGARSTSEVGGVARDRVAHDRAVVAADEPPAVGMRCFL